MRHYFTNNTKVKSNRKIHHVKVNDQSFHFYTDHGVFSIKGLDFGSRLLIDTVLEQPFKHGLDIGCGYGSIGIILKYFNPDSTMDMTEVNQRAIELAKENAKRNAVSVSIYESDGLEQVKGRYDLIVTNPPIRSGKKVYYQFFVDAKSHLTNDGALYVVIQKKQGALSAMAFCETIYKRVELVRKKSGYFVFRCCN